MKKLNLILLASVILVCTARSQVKEPLSVFPGDTVSVTTITELHDSDTVQVTLKAIAQNSETCGLEPIPVEGPGPKSFSFGIPPNACVGLFNLTVTAASKREEQGKAAAVVEKKVDISSPQYIRVGEKAPTVTGISPKALYRGDTAMWTFAFLGSSALKASDEYTVRFTGHALAKCGNGENEPPKNGTSCFAPAASQDGQIAFTLQGERFFTEFEGKQSVSLVRNGAESAAQEMYVVNATRNTPRNYAIAITLALAALIFLLLRAGGKTMQTETDKRSYFLRALFIDNQTETYSLSKCQFYAWTFTALFGYIFFAVARSVIQGNATFPDVPSGLPKVLLLAAGTSVFATGITSAKGSKGAGERHPNLADFITSGGVVAPERLQFVVWTVAGVFAFLTIVFNSDPLTLSELPKIPDGFLELMGVSSAGYLAGKVARKAGPVIASLAVAQVSDAKLGSLGNYEPPEKSPAREKLKGIVMRLGLQGEGLSPNATVKVDNQPLRADEFWINGTPDPQTGFCVNLDLSLNNAEPYLDGPHLLTLVNPDAQAADANFPIDPMVIEGIDPPLPKAPGSVTEVITVKGKNFRSGTSYEWRDISGNALFDPKDNTKPLPDAVGSATEITDTALKVKRPSVVVEGYKLLLISSPAKLRARYPKT